MKTLYLDCQMGAAGDMLTAALVELLPDPEQFIEEMNALGIPHVQMSREITRKCGICGTHISVKVHGHEEMEHSRKYEHEHTHEHCQKHGHGQEHEHALDHIPEYGHIHAHAHHHSRLRDIEHIINPLNLPKTVISDILAVYALIAEAESKVHGVPVSDIHFHEAGTFDAIADITAVCLLMNKISPDEVIASPIHVGSGHVHCAHGILPVPAPATAEILRGVPIYGGKIKGELCTPTGAALLKHFATGFSDMPVMEVASIGYGFGTKDFEVANCVRAILGNTPKKLPDASCYTNEKYDVGCFTDKQHGVDCFADEMYELSCNVDDMTAERIGYALEQFFRDGAVEAFTVPIGMKKSRPGTMICVICSSDQKETLIRSMFKHTSTCGIRQTLVKRSILERTIVDVDTKYGTIRRKDYSGYGIKRSKYEYEDLARIATENDLSIEEVLHLIEENYSNRFVTPDK